MVHKLSIQLTGIKGFGNRTTGTAGVYFLHPYKLPCNNHTTMYHRHELVFNLTIPEPFNVTLTVAKPAGWHWSSPKEVFSNETLWSGVRIGSIPVGLVWYVLCIILVVVDRKISGILLPSP